jgi:flagella basal body P-ring formation protein FlgA
MRTLGSIAKLFAFCGVSSLASASNVSLSWQAILEPSEKTVVSNEPVSVQSADKVETKVETPITRPSLAEEAPVEVVETVTVTPDDILSSLKEELTSLFQLEGELKLFPNTPIVKREVPNEGWYLELTTPFPTELSTRMHLRFRLTNGFDHLPTESLSVRAEYWKDAIVAQRLMRQGELDPSTSSMIKPVNWLLYRGELVESDVDLKILELKTTWRSGDPLRWDQVVTRPVIASGAIVDVVASEGAMKITMRGVATESGNVGDLISVRNMQSRQEIQGVISNANTVLVVF